ncbi:MAG: hydrogenase maturation protease [Thermoanaerobaculia bacterium]|nr:hydrogenase maturation protease [Thermoanaerobaculia bacterium]
MQADLEPWTRGLPAPPVTVVGCGNWLMAVDRVGPRVLRELAGRRRPGVALADVGTTGLGLLDRLSGQELLILVDACVGRTAPGEVLVSHPRPRGRPPAAHRHPPDRSPGGPGDRPRALSRAPPAADRAGAGRDRGLEPEQEEAACGRAVAAVERLLDGTPGRSAAADAPSAAA